MAEWLCSGLQIRVHRFDSGPCLHHFLIFKMSDTDTRPLILTAKLDDEAQKFFNNKREKHFPSERNYLDAHLTLFHHLPPEDIVSIQNTLWDISKNTPTLKATAATIMFMGFGSAYQIKCDALMDIRNTLAEHWSHWLTKQDQQKFNPHVTFQNKVKADKAKALYKNMSESFEAFDFQIMGLSLWYYDNGPWDHIKDYAFKKD